MTFTYFKLPPAKPPGPDCAIRCGTSVHSLAHRGRAARRRIDGERWQGASLTAIDLGRAAGAGRQSTASYILQKDPDGCWYVDQWKEDAAATMRPFAANRHAGIAPARDDAELFFIIEIN